MSACLEAVLGWVHFGYRVVAPDEPEVARRDPVMQEEAAGHLRRAGLLRVEFQRRVCGRVARVWVARVELRSGSNVLRARTKEERA